MERGNLGWQGFDMLIFERRESLQTGDLKRSRDGVNRRDESELIGLKTLRERSRSLRWRFVADWTNTKTAEFVRGYREELGGQSGGGEPLTSGRLWRGC